MMKAINRWLTGLYLGVTGFAQDLKNDERGLSGVVVAVLLILVAVLVIEALVFLFNTTTFFIGILVGPVCLMYTVSGMALPLFREIERENQGE